MFLHTFCPQISTCHVIIAVLVTSQPLLTAAGGPRLYQPPRKLTVGVQYDSPPGVYDIPPEHSNQPVEPAPRESRAPPPEQNARPPPLHDYNRPPPGIEDHQPGRGHEVERPLRHGPQGGPPHGGPPHGGPPHRVGERVRDIEPVIEPGLLVGSEGSRHVSTSELGLNPEEREVGLQGGIGPDHHLIGKPLVPREQKDYSPNIPAYAPPPVQSKYNYEPESYDPQKGFPEAEKAAPPSEIPIPPQLTKSSVGGIVPLSEGGFPGGFNVPNNLKIGNQFPFPSPIAFGGPRPFRNRSPSGSPINTQPLFSGFLSPDLKNHLKTSPPLAQTKKPEAALPPPVPKHTGYSRLVKRAL